MKIESSKALLEIDQIRRHVLTWAKSLVLLMFCAYPFNQNLYQMLAKPLMVGKSKTIIATKVISPFTTPLKLCMFLSFSASMPILLWQLWSYLKPALLIKERQLLAYLFSFGLMFFIFGIITCLKFVLPSTVKVFQNLTPKNVIYMPDMDGYLDFSLTLMLAFGLCFEIPVILVTFIKLNIVSVETLTNKRKEVIIACLTIAMLVTPPDVTSQVMLALPMWLLFELSIFLGKRLTLLH